MFVDDLEMAKIVNCYSDYLAFQEEINKDYSWLKIWCLLLNKNKLVHMYVGHRKNINQYLCEQTITQHESIHKDLGILISDDLSFKSHITSII